MADTLIENPNAIAGTPVLHAEKYRARVLELGIDDEDADAYLQTLFQIMVSLVDLGIDVGAVEQLPFSKNFASLVDAGAVGLKNSRQEEFNGAARAAESDSV